MWLGICICFQSTKRTDFPSSQYFFQPRTGLFQSWSCYVLDFPYLAYLLRSPRSIPKSYTMVLHVAFPPIVVFLTVVGVRYLTLSVGAGERLESLFLCAAGKWKILSVFWCNNCCKRHDYSVKFLLVWCVAAERSETRWLTWDLWFFHIQFSNGCYIVSKVPIAENGGIQVCVMACSSVEVVVLFAGAVATWCAVMQSFRLDQCTSRRWNSERGERFPVAWDICFPYTSGVTVFSAESVESVSAQVCSGIGLLGHKP